MSFPKDPRHPIQDSFRPTIDVGTKSLRPTGGDSSPPKGPIQIGGGPVIKPPVSPPKDTEKK